MIISSRNGRSYVYNDGEVIIKCGRRPDCLSAKAFAIAFGPRRPRELAIRTTTFFLVRAITRNRIARSLNALDRADTIARVALRARPGDYQTVSEVSTILLPQVTEEVFPGAGAQIIREPGKAPFDCVGR